MALGAPAPRREAPLACLSSGREVGPERCPHVLRDSARHARGSSLGLAARGLARHHEADVATWRVEALADRRWLSKGAQR